MTVTTILVTCPTSGTENHLTPNRVHVNRRDLLETSAWECDTCHTTHSVIITPKLAEDMAFVGCPTTNRRTITPAEVAIFAAQIEEDVNHWPVWAMQCENLLPEKETN